MAKKVEKNIIVGERCWNDLISGSDQAAGVVSNVNVCRGSQIRSLFDVMKKENMYKNCLNNSRHTHERRLTVLVCLALLQSHCRCDLMQPCTND